MSSCAYQRDAKCASKEKVIEIKKANDDAVKGNKTKNVEFKHAANFVRSNFVFCFRNRNNTGTPCVMKKHFNLENEHEGVFIELTLENQKNSCLVEPCMMRGVPPKAIAQNVSGLSKVRQMLKICLRVIFFLIDSRNVVKLLY